jgi:hypothetical protein
MTPCLPRILILVVGAVAALLTLGCAERRCKGHPDPCTWLDSKRCRQAPGCSLRTPGCDRANASCPEEQELCGDGGGGCFWTDIGCVNTCSPFTTKAACLANNCNWLECEGEPAKSCEEYSEDECPTEIGCEIESNTWCCG